MGNVVCNSSFGRFFYNYLTIRHTFCWNKALPSGCVLAVCGSAAASALSVTPVSAQLCMGTEQGIDLV